VKDNFFFGSKCNHSEAISEDDHQDDWWNLSFAKNVLTHSLTQTHLRKSIHTYHYHYFKLHLRKCIFAAFIENCENAHYTLIFAEKDSCKNSKLPQIWQNMFISNLHKLSSTLNKLLRLTIKSISTYYKYH
jgi:hypothetical protein